MRPGRRQFQEAKARFSELFRRARSQGPQHLRRHGQQAVVWSERKSKSMGDLDCRRP